jgi:hypothetical protein
MDGRVTPCGFFERRSGNRGRSVGIAVTQLEALHPEVTQLTQQRHVAGVDAKAPL